MGGAAPFTPGGAAPFTPAGPAPMTPAMPNAGPAPFTPAGPVPMTPNGPVTDAHWCTRISDKRKGCTVVQRNRLHKCDKEGQGWLINSNSLVGMEMTCECV